ncbi:MAG: guanylate kinase [Marteilia pararefringens]
MNSNVSAVGKTLRNIPLVITGPSGVGKGTLIDSLLNNHPDRFRLSVSHTTRNIRQGEIDGEHYHFVDKSKFKEMIDNNEFLEHAQFAGNHYGTSRKEFDSAKDTCVIFDIEFQGILHFENVKSEYLKIMIECLDESILRNRLLNRGSETAESLAVRLDTAKKGREALKDIKFDLIIDTSNCSKDDVAKKFYEWAEIAKII